MKLQTKMVLGFSALLLMTVILGAASYMVTDNMEEYAVQSAFIEKGKSDVEKIQTNYLCFTQYQEEKYATAALELVNSAAQHFAEAASHMIDPAHKAEVEQCAADVAALSNRFTQLITHQQEILRLRASGDAQFEQVAAKFDIMQKGQDAIIREEFMVRRLENLKNVYALRIELNRLRAAISALSVNSGEAEHKDILESMKTLKSDLTKQLNNLSSPDNRRNMQAVIDEIVIFNGILQDYMKLLLAAAFL